MARAPTFGNAFVNAETDGGLATLNGGYLRIYDGTKPATADTAITTQNLLAELRWANPAFDPSVAGVAIARTLAAVTAVRTGTGTWFRALEADGVTSAFDGTVGVTSGQFDLVIDSVDIQVGAQVSISGFSYTNPKQ